MNLRARILCLLSVLVVVMLLLPSLKLSAAAPAKEIRKIKVGLALNLTGPVAETTKPESEGLIDMFWWVNEKLGGWQFRNPKTGKDELFKFDVIWEDTGYTPSGGLAAYTRFREAKSDVIVAFATIQSDAIAPLAARDHQPVLAGTLTPASAKVLPRYHIWFAEGYPDYFGAFLEWMAKEKPRAKVGVIAADASFGRSFEIPEVAAHAKKLGIELLPIVYVPYPALSDATVELRRMDSMKPDVIYIQNTAGGGAVVVNDAIKLDLWNKYKWMLSNMCLPGMLMDLTSNRATGANGLYFVADVVSNPKLESVKTMRGVFKERERKGSLGYESLYQFVGVFAVYLSKMLQISLEKFGYPLTPEQIVWGFNNLKNYDWGGFTAYPVTITKEAPLMFRSTYIYRIDGVDNRPIIGRAMCPRLTPIAVSDKAIWE